MPAIAGLFIVDTRLLASTKYLAIINESLLKFYHKFPNAYITLATFDSSPNIMISFQKVKEIPRLHLTNTIVPVKIFDTVGYLLEKYEWLLAIYDISQIYVWIASEPKDQGSKKYTLFDIARIIEEKQKLKWKFYFPFAGFEEMTSRSF